MAELKDPIRNAFEHWFSDAGEWPQAVERDANGNYRLMQAVQSWVAWQAAWKTATASGVGEAQPQQRELIAYHDKDQPNGIAWCPGYPEKLADITPLYAGATTSKNLRGALAAGVVMDRDASQRVRDLEDAIDRVLLDVDDDGVAEAQDVAILALRNVRARRPKHEGITVVTGGQGGSDAG